MEHLIYFTMVILVDEVIMEDTLEQKITDTKKYNIDIFVIGND